MHHSVTFQVVAKIRLVVGTSLISSALISMLPTALLPISNKNMSRPVFVILHFAIRTVMALHDVFSSAREPFAD